MVNTFDSADEEEDDESDTRTDDDDVEEGVVVRSYVVWTDDEDELEIVISLKMKKLLKVKLKRSAKKMTRRSLLGLQQIL